MKDLLILSLGIGGLLLSIGWYLAAFEVKFLKAQLKVRDREVALEERGRKTAFAGWEKCNADLLVAQKEVSTLRGQVPKRGTSGRYEKKRECGSHGSE